MDCQYRAEALWSTFGQSQYLVVGHESVRIVFILHVMSESWVFRKLRLWKRKAGATQAMIAIVRYVMSLCFLKAGLVCTYQEERSGEPGCLCHVEAVETKRWVQAAVGL